MQIGCVKPDEQILLQLLPWPRHAQVRRAIANAGLDGRKERGYQPVNRAGRLIPIGHLASLAPVIDRQEVTARQVLVDQLRQIVRCQLGDGEDLGDRQTADRIACVGVIGVREFESQLLALST